MSHVWARMRRSREIWWLPEGVGFERVSGQWLHHWKGACASLERIDGSHHCSTGFFGGVCAHVERQHRSVLPSAASPASSCMVTACCMPLNSPVSVVCCLREHSVPHIVQEPRHRPGAPCQGWCVTNPSIPPRLQPPTSCTRGPPWQLPPPGKGGGLAVSMSPAAGGRPNSK